MQKFEKQKRNTVRRGVKRALYDIEEINGILDAGFVGYVAYLFEGTAITIPMAYGRSGNRVFFHGSLKNRMLHTLLESKQMSMTVMHLDALVLARSGLHHSVNYRSATVFGSVRKISDTSDKIMALQRIVDHMIEGRWESLRPILPKELDGTLVVEMTIETASAKIRDVGVQDEKGDLNLPIWAGLIPLQQIAKKPISDDLLPNGIEVPEHVSSYYESKKFSHKT